MYSVVICNDDRDCNGRSKNKNRKKAPMVKIGAVYIILQIVFAVQR